MTESNLKPDKSHFYFQTIFSFGGNLSKLPTVLGAWVRQRAIILCFGPKFGHCYLNSIKPRHWFQFADDIAIVTATVEDNQLLLNVFARWCSWAGLSINVKKCSTFGIKKSGSKS